MGIEIVPLDSGDGAENAFEALHDRFVPPVVPTSDGTTDSESEEDASWVLNVASPSRVKVRDKAKAKRVRGGGSSTCHSGGRSACAKAAVASDWESEGNAKTAMAVTVWGEMHAEWGCRSPV